MKVFVVCQGRFSRCAGSDRGACNLFKRRASDGCDNTFDWNDVDMRFVLSGRRKFDGVGTVFLSAARSLQIGWQVGVQVAGRRTHMVVIWFSFPRHIYQCRVSERVTFFRTRVYFVTKPCTRRCSSVPKAWVCDAGSDISWLVRHVVAAVVNLTAFKSRSSLSGRGRSVVFSCC